jgi:hypothetical protein
MQDFPSNSRKAQEETEVPREQLKPVTTAKKTERRTGLGRKFKNTFFGGTGRGAAEHAVSEVIIPDIKHMLHDALTRAVDHVFFGEGPRRPSRSSSSIVTNQNLGRFDYTSPSRPTRASTQARPTVSSASKARHEFADVVIPSMREANDVLEQLYEVLSRDGMVTVADLYALTDIRPDHTDFKWGWTSLRGSRPVRLRSGDFVLQLPEPEGLG